MSASEPGFCAARTGGLKRGSVEGKQAAVTLRAGRLVGEQGGAVWIDPADVASMRVGYDESKSGKRFPTIIVRTSRPQQPLALHPFASYDADYGAPSVAWRRRSSGLGMFVLTRETWWQRSLHALPGGILLALLLRNTEARLAHARSRSSRSSIRSCRREAPSSDGITA